MTTEERETAAYIARLKELMLNRPKRHPLDFKEKPSDEQKEAYKRGWVCGCP